MYIYCRKFFMKYIVLPVFVLLLFPVVVELQAQIIIQSRKITKNKDFNNVLANSMAKLKKTLLDCFHKASKSLRLCLLCYIVFILRI